MAPSVGSILSFALLVALDPTISGASAFTLVPSTKHSIPSSQPSISSASPSSFSLRLSPDNTQDMTGILETVVGYSGSSKPKENLNPTYQNVQDYAESIRIRYDPSIISYGELLELMFHYHTPANPRWAGTQYRSAIFVYNDQQRQMAESYLQDKVGGKLATYVAVEDASDFYKAEEYHQKYLEKAVSNMY